MHSTSIQIRFWIFAFFSFLIGGHSSLLAQDYKYTLEWDNPASHLYQISLTTSGANGPFSDFQIPAWRPGRYYLQDYAAAVSDFSAVDAEGKSLSWKKTDNHTWQVANPASGSITIRYRYYANTMDAGSSVLNTAEAYFNPVNMFMHVRDRYDVECLLNVPSMPTDWKSATALRKVVGQHNAFIASDYHEFVDSPTILSPTIKTLHSRIGETDFYYHFQGEFPDDKATEDAYQENIGKMIREQAAIFGGLPLKEYHFIYHLLPFNIGHAVEHKNSASFAMPATVAQSPQAIGRLNSISSHEFFHLWNVKRIRPAVMWPYNYQEEAHTTLHWFTEGVTDYYTSLTLTRCGYYARETYYKILSRTITSLENNYASKVVSPSQSSFDSWLERSDYQVPYRRISYYTLGTRVGLLLDLEIRRRTEGKLSFDDVFRQMWKDFYEKDKGVGEEDVRKTVEAVTGSDWKAFFQKYVDGTESMDYHELFAPYGLDVLVKDQEGLGLECIGIRRTEKTDYGLYIHSVKPGSDAARAGLGGQDIIAKIQGEKALEWDAKAFFANSKTSVDLEMEVLRASGPTTVRVNWTGNDIPKTYAIKAAKKVKKDQKANLEAWLGSKQ